MKPEIILSSCKQSGVTIRIEGGKLKAHGEKRAVAQILPIIKTHREAIKAYLAWPADIDLERWRYQFHERIGIIQEDCNLTPYSKRLAYIETLVEYLKQYYPAALSEFERIILQPLTH